VTDYKVVDSMAGGIEFELSIEVMQVIEVTRFTWEAALSTVELSTRFRLRLSIESVNLYEVTVDLP
jgi:hypothetical protein